MNPRVLGVIPARYGSSRFPGKILALIAGKPMIQRVYERARQSRLLSELLVAVDDPRIEACVNAFGGQAIMTRAEHQSGTDRIAEVAAKIPADIIVNIQGDQPVLDPLMIDEAVQALLDHPEIPMTTIKTKIQREADLTNSNVVKVVTDEAGRALYFSRSQIPFPRANQAVTYYEHLGLYVYRRDFLLKLAQIPPSTLEQIELLEQLRVLEKGYAIMVVETKSPIVAFGGLSVDIPADIAKVEAYLKMVGEH